MVEDLLRPGLLIHCCREHVEQSHRDEAFNAPRARPPVDVRTARLSALEAEAAANRRTNIGRNNIKGEGHV
jgi:hypothetical protein